MHAPARGPRVADRKRIKEPERDLLRKNRAWPKRGAAGAVKKVAAIFSKGDDEEPASKIARH